ncbi:unnamed protein product [Brachionus calyciflorus]|uniref:C-type lectin domain-containing protein n=1 Tax=Brachionus calyciflorus TaxID=104777 RepID=A0A813WF62_9BILA|nr:unnamed protein product [Brachionus calyciflorus]
MNELNIKSKITIDKNLEFSYSIPINTPNFSTIQKTLGLAFSEEPLIEDSETKFKSELKSSMKSSNIVFETESDKSGKKGADKEFYINSENRGYFPYPQNPFPRTNNNLLSFQRNHKEKNKFFCLQACLMDSQCHYAKYEKKECSLYKHTNIDIFLLGDKTIYQKNMDEDIGMITYQNVLSEKCSNSYEYWSLNTNSCLLCKTGFMKYSELPNFCYLNESAKRNFNESKSYCESKGAFLFTPKTQIEREFFSRRFPNLRAFVDSRISSVGDTYTWPDGSYVFGFDNSQPDNYYHTVGYLLENSLEIWSNGNFNDISSGFQNSPTICQHD